jgi:hypothetical protein
LKKLCQKGAGAISLDKREFPVVNAPKTRAEITAPLEIPITFNHEYISKALGYNRLKFIIS